MNDLAGNAESLEDAQSIQSKNTKTLTTLLSAHRIRNVASCLVALYPDRIPTSEPNGTASCDRPNQAKRTG